MQSGGFLSSAKGTRCAHSVIPDKFSRLLSQVVLPGLWSACSVCLGIQLSGGAKGDEKVKREEAINLSQEDQA